MEQETYKYNSVIVAKMIATMANERHLTVNITKVQKLLYIAYGTYLAVKDERLTNEHPQAWPYGPVFPTTRNRLLKADLYAISVNDPALAEIRQDEDMSALLDLVFDNFGQWTASQLSEWSHGDGSPWQKTVSNDDFKWGERIPDEYIQSYFKTIIVKK